MATGVTQLEYARWVALTQRVHIDPLSSADDAANYSVSSRILFSFSQVLQVVLFGHPVALLMLGFFAAHVLHQGPGADGQNARVWVVGELLLGQWPVEPVVHVLEIDSLRQEQTVLAADRLSDAEHRQESTRLNRAQELQDELLKNARRAILILNHVNLPKDLIN